jgi:excisionase family DNA binding protein
MNKLSFEELPDAVALILEKLDALQASIAGQRAVEAKEQEPLNIDCAATFLGLAKATLYSKVCRGEIPAFKLGKKLLFDRIELHSYLLENRTKTNFHLRREVDTKLAKRNKKRTYTY